MTPNREVLFRQAERPGNRLACPHCLSPSYLFENVSGWREIGGVRMVEGRVLHDQHYGRAEDLEHQSYGCSNKGCDVEREIHARELVQIASDGTPIPEPIKGQEALDV